MTLQQQMNNSNQQHSNTSSQITPSAKTILYVVAEDHYFLSHRLPMARAAEQAGLDIAVAAPAGRARAAIEAAGFEFYPLQHFHRTSLTPLKEIKAVLELIKLYRTLRPTLVHHVAMKPVLYGSIAAFFNSSTRVINALGGLGFIFMANTFKARVLRFIVGNLFKVLLGRNHSKLILQNRDDQQTLINAGLITQDKTILIAGSGVDPDFYAVIPELEVSAEGPVIAYVGRMLRDKGILELVEAARILKSRGIKAQFWLYGDVDPKNPTSMTAEQMQTWHAEGLIKWCGPVQDARHAYQSCHIAVLPSYREGLPKSLLEAASCARPIVTTDVPGCREVVENTVNGFLVPVRCPLPLAEALAQLIADPSLRHTMGQQGRGRVLKYFADHIITDQTCAVYRQMLGESK